MQRTSSAPLRLLFEDTTAYDDPLLGLNGRAVIEPLPAEIEVAVPAAWIPMGWNFLTSVIGKALRVCPSSSATWSPSVAWRTTSSMR